MSSPSSHRALLRAPLSASLLSISLGLCACDPVVDPSLDASVAADAAASDAPAPDPGAVRWEAVDLPEAFPGGWGWSSAELDDGRTLVLGGAIGVDADAVLDRVLVIEPGETLAVRELAVSGDGPAPRWCACATYDAARGRVLFAGGRNLDALGGIAGTTWELDPETGGYRELAATPTPAGVIGCALAHAPARRATYWFGGASSATISGAMYRLHADGDTWVEVEAPGPTPRYDAELVALDERRLLLFGGSYGSSGAAFYSDVWIFDTETESWSEVEVGGASPPGRRTPWLRLDDDGSGLYAGFGYDGRGAPLGDLHHFDLESASWLEIAVPEPVPAARGFSRAARGPEGSIGLLLPGLGRGAVVRDAYVLAR
jgi:hypothetical protein